MIKLQWSFKFAKHVIYFMCVKLTTHGQFAAFPEAASDWTTTQ